MLNSYIFHIDFDCFFVSAIRKIRPNLKNKPVAICKNAMHAIAVSISYELRNLGIKVGATKQEILKKEPKTIFVESHFELFNYVSSEIFDYIAKNISNKIEISSIDECYIDVSHLVNNDNQAKALAKKIQNIILKRFDIPVTIGISNNKFAAKLTTNINKPFGIGLTNQENFKSNFFDLPIAKYHGIGKKIAFKLQQIGINTIGDLAACKIDDIRLDAILGSLTYKYLEVLNPDFTQHISYKDTQPKGIGNEITFNNKFISLEEIQNNLNNLAKKVSTRMIQHNLVGDVLTINVRLNGKKWTNKQVKLNSFTNDYLIIFHNAMALFNDFFEEQLILGIGIRMSNLTSVFDHYQKQSLFDQIQDSKTSYQVQKIINQINRKIKNNITMTMKDYQKKKSQSDFLGEFSQTQGIYKK
ncbi:DNA polymerase IV [Mycoplasma sp. NEAQ87857]|uniref:Y-family DNA polymerase n=1 Tax=Mycoplasma sp. NEAQ87857 TaxID=2683967 RepID=UPI001318AC30|nr:DNA polymerase IV [Mycoplasma sp. NEAQ87857]QGZ97883.1 DNA polymerase IV [Mycoplasma sp. NEAQ87857]